MVCVAVSYTHLENAKDINNAKANGISSAMIDRLLPVSYTHL